MCPLHDDENKTCCCRIFAVIRANKKVATPLALPNESWLASHSMVTGKVLYWEHKNLNICNGD